MPTAALSGLKKFKWLRERMKNVSSATVLMNHIKDFLLREEKIDLEKITNAMHSQVMKCLFNLFNFLLLPFCEDVRLIWIPRENVCACADFYQIIIIIADNLKTNKLVPITSPMP